MTTPNTPPPSNRGTLPHGFIESNEGPLVEIDPSYTDAQVLDAWEGVLSLGIPEHSVIDRMVFHQYSARQCHEIGVEPGTWWGADGELKTWVMVAEVREGEPA